MPELLDKTILLLRSYSIDIERLNEETDLDLIITILFLSKMVKFYFILNNRKIICLIFLLRKFSVNYK